MSPKSWIILAGIVGAAGVILGAFGAHGIPDYLKKQGLSPEEVATRLDWFETAVRYHMYHAPLFIGVGLLALHGNCRWLTISGFSALVGILIFSGLLYVMAMTGITKLGMIVPIGGLALIVAWVTLAISGLHLPPRAP